MLKQSHTLRSVYSHSQTQVLLTVCGTAVESASSVIADCRSHITQERRGKQKQRGVVFLLRVENEWAERHKLKATNYPQEKCNQCSTFLSSFPCLLELLIS